MEDEPKCPYCQCPVSVYSCAHAVSVADRYRGDAIIHCNECGAKLLVEEHVTYTVRKN